MKIEVSNGEIVDKFTILLIKAEKIQDEEKLKNVQKELEALKMPMSLIPVRLTDFRKLKAVNEKLWNVEEKIRRCDKELTFNVKFINLARRVYKLNDERAAIKKSINIDTNSQLTEEKSYN
jgi:hypothetical protein